MMEGGGYLVREMMRSYRREHDLTGQGLRRGGLRRIAGLVKPYTGTVTALILLIAFDAAAGASTPLLFRAIVNRGILAHDTGLIITLAAICAGIALLSSALSIVQRFCSARLGESLIHDLRTSVFSHVQRMPIAFFTRTQTGSLVSRLNSDVLGAQQAFTTTLAGLVGNILTSVITIVAMFVLSWQITLVALAALPVFLLPARRVGRRLAAITRESYRLNATMTTQITERFSVSGAQLVKLFGRNSTEAADFGVHAARVRDIGITQAVYSRTFIAALTLLASLTIALVYGWGGVQAAHGGLDVGTVVAMAAFLTRLYMPLASLTNVHVDIAAAVVSFDRVFEVLDLVPLVRDREDASGLPQDSKADLEFDGVSFRYPTAEEVSLASLESVETLDTEDAQPVLHGVSFRCAPGSLTALVGPSGAGKTTIINLITRLYDPTAGAIRIGGFDLREVTQDSLRDRVGVVTQDPHMFHDSIRANLLYANPDASDERIAEALRTARIDALVDSLPQGLDTVVGERGHRLSGGEKQRLAIARMILKDPQIVILDEATAHLDSESEAAIQEALNAVLVNRTSVVIAHRLSTIRKADQILVVDGGSITERGSHEQLIAFSGTYADLHRTQFEPQEI